jgi:hypothetical protein
VFIALFQNKLAAILGRNYRQGKLFWHHKSSKHLPLRWSNIRA